MLKQQNLEKLAPTNALLRAKTVSALESRVGKQAIDDFITRATSATAPSPITGRASIIVAVIWGKVTCDPDGQPWRFDHDVWGIGAAGGDSIGILYTAYDSWDAFFMNTAGFHVQGIADAGGILQINFFNKGGVPIGQYNGAMAGVGVFETGGSGGWKRV